jgi:glycosyltransferase involved in cell wall biosynthesis
MATDTPRAESSRALQAILKSRLLYVTHVDWGHVRQRPHHLADGLAAYFDVTVAFPVGRHRSWVVTHPQPDIRLAPLIRTPGSYRSAAMLHAANALAAMQVRFIALRHPPDIVLVTAPECFAWLSPSLRAKILGYDCMDDALAFAQDPSARALKAAWERELLERADFVTCTSETLRRRCAERGARPEQLAVVPNGWDPGAFPIEPPRPIPATGPLVLGYFGAIAEWLDFAALEALVSTLPEVTVRLIGPNLCGYVSPHSRLVLDPPVEHGALPQAVRDVDVLLLPFQVTELTRAVDPVKLYEYIALGRPVLAARYPELQQFASFVTFYDGIDELVQRLRNRSSGIAAVVDTTLREAWLLRCRWSERVCALAKLIEAKTSGKRSAISGLTQ